MTRKESFTHLSLAFAVINTISIGTGKYTPQVEGIRSILDDNKDIMAKITARTYDKLVNTRLLGMNELIGKGVIIDNLVIVMLAWEEITAPKYQEYTKRLKKLLDTLIRYWYRQIGDSITMSMDVNDKIMSKLI